MCVISWALVAAAMPLDRPIAQWVRALHIEPWIMHSFAVNAVKALGVYGTTVAIAIIVGGQHPLRWRASVFILMTGLVCLVGNIMKWMVGRTRPFKLEHRIGEAVPFKLQPFRSGWEGLFAQENLAFPSGHTMVAFATAAGLAILWPRWRWYFYGGAALVAAERVLENAHWLSDTVGAAGLAICGVHLMWRFLVWANTEPRLGSEPLPAPKFSQ